MTLYSEFLGHRDREIHKWTHYFPAYERHFGPFVNRPVRMLEIGLGEGGSVQMWKRYLGPLAQIVGIDINPRTKEFEEPQVSVEIGDQADPEFLAAVVRDHGPFDLILDDGSHVMKHIAASFKHLYPTMPNTGVYAVEDLHTCYWGESVRDDVFEGGLKREGTFVEIAKDLIDELNAGLSRGAVEPTEFTESTTSMHFYDSMIFFERGYPTVPVDATMGARKQTAIPKPPQR